MKKEFRVDIYEQSSRRGVKAKLLARGKVKAHSYDLARAEARKLVQNTHLRKVRSVHHSAENANCVIVYCEPKS